MSHDRKPKLPDGMEPFELVNDALRYEEVRLIEYNRNHHIPTLFERYIESSLKVLRGDSGDAHTAEGMAAGKMGIPVEWCSYHEEGYPRHNWLAGHRVGRIYIEAHPPSTPVLERLAALLEKRLRKNERDCEHHLMQMIAREIKGRGETSSALEKARKHIARLEGQYVPAIENPAVRLRITIEPITVEHQPAFRAVCHGIKGSKSIAATRERAALGTMQEACNILSHMIERGQEFDFEFSPPGTEEDRG